MRKLLGFFLGFGAFILLATIIKFGIDFLGGNFPQLSFPVISIFLLFYIFT